MKITVNLKVKDLLYLSGYTMLRLKMNWIILLSLMVLNGIGLYLKGFSIHSSVLSGFVIACLCMLLGYIVQCILIVISARKSEGFLGEHIFEIVEDGLLEKTSANQTINYWNGIFKIRKTSLYLLIYISPLICHILPRRNFHNNDEFNSFYEILCDKLSEQVLK